MQFPISVLLVKRVAFTVSDIIVAEVQNSRLFLPTGLVQYDTYDPCQLRHAKIPTCLCHVSISMTQDSVTCEYRMSC